MFKRIALVAAAGVAVAGLAVPAADAQPKTKHAVKKQAVHRSTKLLVGINDEADTLYGDPPTAFAGAERAEDAGAAREPLLGR